MAMVQYLVHQVASPPLEAEKMMAEFHKLTGCTQLISLSTAAKKRMIYFGHLFESWLAGFLLPGGF
jgi:hypothetical protein